MNQDPQRLDGLTLDPLHLQHLYSAPYLHPLCRGPASVSQTSLPLAQNQPNTFLTSGLEGLLLRGRLLEGPWLTIGPCAVGTAWTPGLQGPSTSLRFLFLEKCLKEQQSGTQEANILNTR